MYNLYSEEIAIAVSDFLNNREVDYKFVKNDGIFTFRIFLEEDVLCHIDFIIHIRNHDLIVYGICPVRARCSGQDPRHRILDRLSYFFTLTNYRLGPGNFELDVQDGEIGCKCYLNCIDSTIPSDESLWSCIKCILSIYRRHIKGILMLLSTNATPEEALSVCDGHMPSPAPSDSTAPEETDEEVDLDAPEDPFDPDSLFCCDDFNIDTIFGFVDENDEETAETETTEECL